MAARTVLCFVVAVPALERPRDRWLRNVSRVASRFPLTGDVDRRWSPARRRDYVKGLQACVASLRARHRDLPPILVLTPDRLPAIAGVDEVIQIDRRPYDAITKVGTYFGREVYYKLGVFGLSGYDRVVYLDCDTIALADVSALWDPAQHADADLYAVRETAEMGMVERGALGKLNTGVMVVNRRLLDGAVRDRLLEIARAGLSYDGGDQGVVNYYVEHEPGVRVGELDAAYNVFTCAKKHGRWDELGRHVRILHFVNDRKPWTPDRRADRFYDPELQRRWDEAFAPAAADAARSRLGGWRPGIERIVYGGMRRLQRAGAALRGHPRRTWYDVTFRWGGVLYRLRENGAVVRRRPRPIRVRNGFVRIASWYPVDPPMPRVVEPHPAPADARAYETEVVIDGRNGGPSFSADGPVHLYVLSYNAPAQFECWLAAARAVEPDLVELPRRVLIDYSTEPYRDAYAALCRAHGFEHLRAPNKGIAGAHLDASFHAATNGAAGMLLFEDDMLLWPHGGLCRNGLPRTVPSLYRNVLAIAEKEGLDVLKLCFSEVHLDHHVNCTWCNLDGAERERTFPAGPATRVDRVGTHGGISYLVGDVHFDHWPTLLTRRALESLYLDRTPDDVVEPATMRRAHGLLAAGELSAGVLLASPIEHRRDHDYDPRERQE